MRSWAPKGMIDLHPGTRNSDFQQSDGPVALLVRGVTRMAVSSETVVSTFRGV